MTGTPLGELFIFYFFGGVVYFGNQYGIMVQKSKFVVVVRFRAARLFQGLPIL